VTRARVAAAALTLILAAGCGYIGPVLPPSPQIPDAVTDLAAIERGKDIVIKFTAPVRTTDNLIIGKFADIDLRIGPEPVPFDFDKWAAGAKRVPVSSALAIDRNEPQAIPVDESIPANAWVGQHVVVAVRTSVKSTDHFSAWSNRATLNVIPPLDTPAAKATSTAKGILLTWEPVVRGAKYRIYRRQPTEETPLQIGESATADYLDTTAQFEIPYQYSVVAAKGTAESLPSEAVTITTNDIFPPSVPASITAVAGPDSIQISWQRSPESNLKGYYLYRSVNGGPFERIDGLILLPVYSDQNVQHGKTYRYEVSALSQTAHESAKSTPTEVQF
jgi:hypothetical protein